DVVGAAERDHWKTLRVDLQHRHVRVRVPAHDLRDELPPILEHHTHTLRVRDDVVVRQDVAVLTEDETRAAPLPGCGLRTTELEQVLPRRAPERIRHLHARRTNTLHLHVHHARESPLRRAPERATQRLRRRVSRLRRCSRRTRRGAALANRIHSRGARHEHGQQHRTGAEPTHHWSHWSLHTAFSRPSKTSHRTGGEGSSPGAGESRSGVSAPAHRSPWYPNPPPRTLPPPIANPVPSRYVTTPLL